jgi:hypothetical protein
MYLCRGNAKHNVKPCTVAMLYIAYTSREFAVPIYTVASAQYKILFRKFIANSEFQLPCE